MDGVFVGLSTIDLMYRVADFPVANTKTAAYSQQVSVGGPATNAAIAFTLLGGKATIVSAIGRHPLTSLFRDEFKKLAIDSIDLSPEFGDIPAFSSAAVDDEGRRSVISANAARIQIPPVVIDQHICKTANVVLVDGHAMSACQAWANAAYILGKPVVMDAGSWKEGTEELLKFVHTAICSADFRAPGCASESELAKYLQSRGVVNVAITHGGDPVRFFTESKTGEIPVPVVAAVDTMGAGDIFHGAFCYFTSTGCGFEESLVRAAEIASDSCCYRGTREWKDHLHSDPAGLLR